jgi:hypothetical protein
VIGSVSQLDLYQKLLPVTFDGSFKSGVSVKKCVLSWLWSTGTGEVRYSYSTNFTRSPCVSSFPYIGGSLLIRSTLDFLRLIDSYEILLNNILLYYSV